MNTTSRSRDVVPHDGAIGIAQLAPTLLIAVAKETSGAIGFDILCLFCAWVWAIRVPKRLFRAAFALAVYLPHDHPIKFISPHPSLLGRGRAQQYACRTAVRLVKEALVAAAARKLRAPRPQGAVTMDDANGADGWARADAHMMQDAAMPLSSAVCSTCTQGRVKTMSVLGPNTQSTPRGSMLTGASKATGQ